MDILKEHLGYFWDYLQKNHAGKSSKLYLSLGIKMWIQFFFENLFCEFKVYCSLEDPFLQACNLKGMCYVCDIVMKLVWMSVRRRPQVVHRIGFGE